MKFWSNILYINYKSKLPASEWALAEVQNPNAFSSLKKKKKKNREKNIMQKKQDKLSDFLSIFSFVLLNLI